MRKARRQETLCCVSELTEGIENEDNPTFRTQDSGSRFHFHFHFHSPYTDERHKRHKPTRTRQRRVRESWRVDTHETNLNEVKASGSIEKVKRDAHES